MKAKGAGVEVVGLDALGADFARMATDPEIRRIFQDAGLAALEPVMTACRAALPHVSGDLAGSLRTRRNRLGASGAEGSPKLNYAGPVDFGAWPPGRPFVKAGRYLYPAAMSLAAVAQRNYEQAVVQGIANYRWTNRGGTEPHD